MIIKEFMFKIDPAVTTKHKRQKSKKQMPIKLQRMRNLTPTLQIVLQKKNNSLKRSTKKQKRSNRANNQIAVLLLHHQARPLHPRNQIRKGVRDAKYDILSLYIQMQNSKGQKIITTIPQIIKKIQKIKADISCAQDYLQLQKIVKKLQKVETLISAQFDRKSKRQIKVMLDGCQQLIKQKTKFFKKRILNDMAKVRPREQSQSPKQKTLKLSKSMDNFKTLLEQQKKNVAPEDEQIWGDRTEIANRKHSNAGQFIEKLQQQLSQYKKKVNDLEKAIENMSSKQKDCGFSYQQTLNQKYRQKCLEVEQLKGKLKYYQTLKEDMRNKLSNEQRRQEDYITSLKKHIEKLSGQTEHLVKQNRKFHDQLERSNDYSTKLKNQVRKLTEEKQSVIKNYRQYQQNQILKYKDIDIKKQIQSVSMQQKCMRQMEAVLMSEKQQKIILLETVETLKKRISLMNEQLKTIDFQREKLEELNQIHKEQLESLKRQLIQQAKQKNKDKQQLLNMKFKLDKIVQQKQDDRQKSSYELRKKAENLKQIKQLIEGK